MFVDVNVTCVNARVWFTWCFCFLHTHDHLSSILHVEYSEGDLNFNKVNERVLRQQLVRFQTDSDILYKWRWLLVLCRIKRLGTFVKTRYFRFCSSKLVTLYKGIWNNPWADHSARLAVPKHSSRTIIRVEDPLTAAEGGVGGGLRARERLARVSAEGLRGVQERKEGEEEGGPSEKQNPRPLFDAAAAALVHAHSRPPLNAVLASLEDASLHFPFAFATGL